MGTSLAGFCTDDLRWSVLGLNKYTGGDSQARVTDIQKWKTVPILPLPPHRLLSAPNLPSIFYFWWLLFELLLLQFFQSAICRPSLWTHGTAMDGLKSIKRPCRNTILSETLVMDPGIVTCDQAFIYKPIGNWLMYTCDARNAVHGGWLPAMPSVDTNRVNLYKMWRMACHKYHLLVLDAISTSTCHAAQKLCDSDCDDHA